jgi:glycosyltransferase involved in cell wall biosynthesis
MDLSIVIPTRNRPAFLESLLSALDLQRGDEKIEVAVIDDCSSPEFKKQNENLCTRFKSKYAPHTVHSRQSITRNAGIRSAQGEWVAFLDDDVSVDPAWVSTALSLIRNAGSDIVGFEGKTIPSGDGLWDREVQNLKGGLYLTTNKIGRAHV